MRICGSTLYSLVDTEGKFSKEEVEISLRGYKLNRSLGMGMNVNGIFIKYTENNHRRPQMIKK